MRNPLWSLLLPVAVSAQAPAPAPSVRSVRLEAQATIDGRLDEPMWQQAARLDGFHQYRPVDGRPAEDSTVVLVWYSPSAIYFGIRAYDREPGAIRATLAKRDNIGSDDEVVVYLDTFNDRRRAYFFGSNPLGIQDDGVRSEAGFSAASMQMGQLDRSPDFTWQSAARPTDFGYVVEMRIPFKSLRYAGGDDQTWGLNITRTNQRTGYEDTWTDVRRASQSFLGQSGTIVGIHGISRGIVTEIQPAIVSQLPGMRLANGEFRRGDVHAELGGNLRLGFTNLTLDATVNPDFSQVEADAGLVTLNQRFALQYPERRPFFLEGIELFASPNDLVYTRSITNPLAGAKLTGKFGAWSLAHLTAIDQGTEGEPNAFVSFTRARHDLGRSSVAGLTVTDREQGGAHNRVVSGDTRLIFGKVYYVAAQLAASGTRDSASGAGHTEALWELEMDRTGRAHGFNYKLTGIKGGFESWSGFVPRTDIVNGRASERVSLYGRPGALLEQVTAFASYSRVWRYRDFVSADPIEGEIAVNSSFTLRGGWDVNAGLSNDFTRFDPGAYADYSLQASAGPAPFTLSPGVFDAWGGNVRINTPQYPLWSASLNLRTGTTAIFPEASRGSSRSVSGTLTLRPTASLRASGSLTWNRLLRTSDRSEFGRSIIPRLKVEFQPTSSLFFRWVGEYRSDRQAALRDPTTGLPILIGGVPGSGFESNRLRMDWLASYEPTQGTVAYFGYGSTLRGDRPLTLRDLQRRDDAFFLKLQYLLRR